MRLVFMAWIDWTWLFTLVSMERISVMSSATPARPGSNSDSSVPDWPHFLNFHGLARTFELAWAASSYWILAGNAWPSHRASASLGSNRSRWLGPPCMNRDIIAFAFGAKCGGRGARSSGPRAWLGLVGEPST